MSIPKVSPKHLITPTEHEEQKALFEWASMQAWKYPGLDFKVSICEQGVIEYG